MSDSYTITVPKDMLGRWLSCSAVLLAPSKYTSGEVELYITETDVDEGPGVVKSDPILYNEEDREQAEQTADILNRLINGYFDE